MSRNQPENILKIFVFILFALLLIIITGFALFNFLIPEFSKSQLSREVGITKSSKTESPVNKNYSSSTSQKISSTSSSSLDLQSSEKDNESENIQNLEYSNSSSSESYEKEKQGRGNYNDQIGAYDNMQSN